MEMVLALAVMLAVIIFGAMISVGNERQRRAIDGLREQVVLWAMQDLKIKRERLAREIHVEEPLAWLNHATANVLGQNLRIEVIEVFDQPKALVCHSGDGYKIVFTPLSPVILREMFHTRHDRLAQIPLNNPLLSLHRGIKKYEISVLNGGMLFDLELPLAWKGLTGQQIDQSDRLWLYIIP